MDRSLLVPHNIYRNVSNRVKNKQLKRRSILDRRLSCGRRAVRADKPSLTVAGPRLPSLFPPSESPWDSERWMGIAPDLVSWARQAHLPAEHRHGSAGRSSPAVKRLYEVSPAETVWGHSIAIPLRRSLQGPSTALGGHPMERCSTLSCGLKGGARPLKG